MAFVNPIQTVPTRFGQQVDKEIEQYVWERITSIENATKTLRETKIKKWRRILKGVPEEQKKSFPWENASNVVIQLAGTCRDILQAAIMGSIWSVLPIYTAGLIGEWDETEQGEKQRKVIEDSMSYFASEPGELDLYRVENLWFSEGVGVGTSFLKSPYEYLVEKQVVGITGDGSPIENNLVKRYGPVPDKIPFEDFGVDPKASTLESADFKYHIRRLRKWDLQERANQGLYSKDLIAKIIGMPDRNGPDPVKQEQQQDQGITLSNCSIEAEWDVFECWFTYIHNGNKYRLLYPYHYKSRTTLKSVFNFYPDNEDPFNMHRLAWEDDGIYGLGFAEMLDLYQEEVSTGHNQRCDNRTLQNTSILRVSRMSTLDSNFSVYPLATLPGEKDEIETMTLGSPMAPDIEGESLTISLAEKRAGIEMGISGPGGGVTNPKKGIYSAMGTFAVMQAGNKRNNLRTTDARYSHIALGRKILKLYAYFGLGDKANIFGKEREILVKALENVKSGRLGFPIRAATESINKELEKQNLMLLVNVVKQHHMGIAQILQSISQAGPMMDQDTKKYLIDMIKAADYLMQDLLRAFNLNDIARLLPLPEFIKKGANINEPGNNTGSQNNSQASVGNDIQQVNGKPSGSVPISSSGLPEVSGIPS